MKKKGQKDSKKGDMTPLLGVKDIPLGPAEASDSSKCMLTKLRGHKKAVNTLDTSIHNENFVCSGSDDRSARLWDLRTDKSIRCALGFFEGPVEAICFDNYNEHWMYCSDGCNLSALDLRMNTIILTSPAMRWKGITSDDISCIRSSHNRAELAISDDSGCLSLLDATQFADQTTCGPGSGLRQYSGLHSSILSCVSYRGPDCDEIACGGFDCQLNVWNCIESAKRISSNFSDPSALLGSTGNSAPQQFFNPAFIHGIDFVCDGELIAAAVGDGSIRLMNSSNGEPLAIEWEAHNGMASNIFGIGNCFLSAGIDKIIRAWSVVPQYLTGAREERGQRLLAYRSSRASIAATAAASASQSALNATGEDAGDGRDDDNDAECATIETTSSEVKKGNNKSSKKKNKKKKSAKLPHAMNVVESCSLQSEWSIEHHTSINCIAAVKSLPLLQSPVFVADTSTEISIYRAV